MDWGLGFISEDDFESHVGATIQKYGEKLEPYDIKRFNKNIIDPIKLIFDKTVYQSSWKEMVGNEIFRQRDKSNNNDIGYFHQRIFQYIDKCRVPDNGKEGGWDVIYQDEEGIALPDGDIVHTVYVEMKNKHNTMNSASAGKTYIKMQNQLLNDDDCACFLVEAIAQKSQNIKWETTVDGKRVSHKRIRRVSLDQFYDITTGEKNAFYKMCMVLPEVIEKIGYEYLGEFGIADRRYLRKGGDERTHQIHIFAETDRNNVVRHIAFRDYMRTHMQDRDKYSKLKKELALKYPYHIESYCEGKDLFVKDMETKALALYKLQNSKGE